jgi:hypothetical protein
MRDDAILFTLSRPRFTFEELQRHLGMERGRVYGVLFGGTEEFAVDLALVPLQIVRQVRSYVGVEFEVTEHGLRQAGARSRATARPAPLRR